MRKHLFIFIFFISVISYSQNWNVFNKGYRYNYKFNNSSFISNVLFADSVLQTGSDTTYIMNKIGIITGSVLAADQPQFFQKKIIKKANGIVQFQTANALTLVPTCSLNQTWLFDSSNNYSATCVAFTTETVFSIVDSVKTILINNSDSIKLSKKFGIIQFPESYAQNLYYRLVGIEDGSKYDSIPLVGLKVPNAWDFYNYQIGQGLCTNYSYLYGGTPFAQHCALTYAVVLSKTITPTGYIYLMSQKTVTSNFSNSCNPYSTNPFVNVTTTITGLNSTSLLENRMYPGMLAGSPHYANVVTLGLDAQGVSKYYGPATYTTDVQVTNNYAPSYSLNTGFGSYSLKYTVGIGKAYQSASEFELAMLYSTGCGTLNVGLKENTNTSDNTIYPNPAKDRLTISIDMGKIKLVDMFGRIVLDQILDRETVLDISSFPSGLYLVEIQTDSFKSSQKLIIQH